ncbi:nucleolus protein [Trichosporon asahii var. asahii CBS 8904]|uniref:Nucleolus protein n=1 Tax=Trichosporon asahii var. asahii (strain CBS 8904) TaxID=1220162 RepID=K1VPK9_TRIAC|nr:nucleolus protein [Trichosporon asahii var. asahii CBS 8904]
MAPLHNPPILSRDPNPISCHQSIHPNDTMEMLMAAAEASSSSQRPRNPRAINDHVDNSPGFVSAMRSTAYEDDESDNENDYYANSYSLSLRGRSSLKSPRSAPRSPLAKKKKKTPVAFDPKPLPESMVSPDHSEDEGFNLGEVTARKDLPVNNSFVTFNAFDPPAGMTPESTGAEVEDTAEEEPVEPVEVLQTPSPAVQQEEPEVAQPSSVHEPPADVEWSTINDPTDPTKTPCPDGITQEQWHVALKIRHNKSVAWSDYTPELLRAALPTQAAIHEFLASRWIPIKELHRLESFGVFTYKRGKFTDAEKRSLRMYLEDFQEVHQLSDAELVDLLMSKGKNTEKNRYGKFWPELAGAVPGRPVRYVKEVVKRMYDPRGRKGEWTMEEDFKLKQAYELYPNQWVKIAEEVQRTEFDCRDRWKGELKGRDSRKTGAWSEEEVQKLIEAVKSANVAAGLDPLSGDTPWDVVVTNMGGTRTRTQCRKKWQDSLQGGRAVGRKTRVGVDHALLINRLRELDYQHERDIEWMKVPWDDQVKPATLRSTWSVIVRQVEDQILDKLQVYVKDQAAIEKRKADQERKKQERREAQAKLVEDAKARAAERQRKQEKKDKKERKKAKRAAEAAALLAQDESFVAPEPEPEPVEAVPEETEKQRRKREKREKRERKEEKRKRKAAAAAVEEEEVLKKPRIEELEGMTPGAARKTLWWKK